MSLPKPDPFVPSERGQRCIVCNHPWAHDFIEMLYEETHKHQMNGNGIGAPDYRRPTVPELYACLVSYYEKHHEAHGLAAPPRRTSVESHVSKNKHSKNYRLWESGESQ